MSFAAAGKKIRFLWKKHKKTARRLSFGAGEGNRTLVTSLEGWRSTIELHPHSGRSSRI